jgi:hypothetical protein
MPAELLAWMFLGLFAVVACHELTHVLIARAHGHPTVCVAVNPVGVAVVFEDTPSRSYWAWQVVLPMIVTAVLSYIWLLVMVTSPSQLQAVFAARGVVDALPLTVLVMALLTSGGDILGLVMETRRPVWGDDRILRDLRILRRVPSLVRFTAYGRSRWGPAWQELGMPTYGAPAAPLTALD